MSSSGIVKAVREATGGMYAPVLDILSIKHDAGAVTDQLATIKDIGLNSSKPVFPDHFERFQ